MKLIKTSADNKVAHIKSPDRPSTFRETQGERTINTEESHVDYPTKVVEELEPYGWPDPTAAAPVYLVEPPPSDTSYVTWRPGNAVVAYDRVFIAAADRRRTRMVIENVDDTNSVVLMAGNSDSSFMGYILSPGKDQEFLHNAQVFAVVHDPTGTGGLSAAVTWFTESILDDPEPEEKK